MLRHLQFWFALKIWENIVLALQLLRRTLDQGLPFPKEVALSEKPYQLHLGQDRTGDLFSSATQSPKVDDKWEADHDLKNNENIRIYS